MSAFHDIPAEKFPVTFIAFNAAGVEVWREVITEPGALLVPALAKTHGPVTIRVEFADGTVEDA
jgi:hypothetical protein